MNKYFNTLTNARGDSLPGYRAQVVNSAGSIVTIYADGSGTRFTDASGNNVNYATADASGKVEFYWTAADGQVLQVLDTTGSLDDSTADFADNFVLDNLPGSIAAASASFTRTSSGSFNADTTLGARAEQVVLPTDFGIDMTGATDSTAALQKAFNWGQEEFNAGRGIPTLQLPQGIIKVSSTITRKALHLVGTGYAGAGTAIQWDGAAGGTMFTTDAATYGGSVKANLIGMTLQEGTATPATFVLFDNGTIDKGCIFRALQFSQCSSHAISIKKWTNLHWNDMRFDLVGGAAIYAVLQAGTSYSSFVLDQFTYHGTSTAFPGYPADCMMKINNEAGVSPGIIAITNSRIESDGALDDNAVIVSQHTGDLDYHFSNIELAIPGTPKLVSHDSSIGTGGADANPRIQINALRSSGYALVGGNVAANYPTVPNSTNWGSLTASGLGATGSELATAGGGLRIYMYAGGGSYPFRFYQGAAAHPLLQATDNGLLQFGDDGTAAPDVSLSNFSSYLQLTTLAGRGFIPSASGRLLGTSSLPWLVHATEVQVGGVKVLGTQQAANADTSGATLADLEIEVNELKAALRAHGLIAT